MLRSKKGRKEGRRERKTRSAMASRKTQYSWREQKRQGRVHCAKRNMGHVSRTGAVAILHTDSAHDVIGGQLGNGQKVPTTERIAQLQVTDLTSPASKEKKVTLCW